VNRYGGRNPLLIGATLHGNPPRKRQWKYWKPNLIKTDSDPWAAGERWEKTIQKTLLGKKGSMYTERTIAAIVEKPNF
jgi:hypothetical protein